MSSNYLSRCVRSGTNADGVILHIALKRTETQMVAEAASLLAQALDDIIPADESYGYILEIMGGEYSKVIGSDCMIAGAAAVLMSMSLATLLLMRASPTLIPKDALDVKVSPAVYMMCRPLRGIRGTALWKEAHDTLVSMGYAEYDTVTAPVVIRTPARDAGHA